MKNTRAIGIIAALTLTLSACAGESTTTSEAAPGIDTQKKVIKIGAYGPKTGESTIYYQGVLGARAYFKMINAQGGVDGWTFEYVDRDDQYNPSQTTLAARQLVEQDKVFAIVNGTGTSQTKAIIPYMQRSGIPNVAPAAGGDLFEETGFLDNFFPITPSFRKEAALLATYAIEKLGATKLGLFYRNDAVGLPTVPGFKEAAGDKAVITLSHPTTEVNFASYAQQLKESGADAVIVWSGGPQLVGIQKAAAAIGYEPTWLGAWFAATAAYFDLGGAPGTYFDAWQTPIETETEGTATFRDNLVKYEPQAQIGGTAQQGWINAEVFVEAVRRMLDKHDTPTWEGLTEALETFDNWNASMAKGITFTENSRQGVNLEYIIKSGTDTFEVVESEIPLAAQ